MAGKALVEFQGHLGGDPELRFTPAGKAVANFSVAVTDRVKDASGEWADGETTWFRIVAWEHVAEAVAEHLRKGDKVFVRGPEKVQQYEAKDGSTGLSREVTVNGREWFVAVLPKPPAKGQPQQQKDADDPWASNSNDEPPF